jgi:hypothetical protein
MLPTAEGDETGKSGPVPGGLAIINKIRFQLELFGGEETQIYLQKSRMRHARTLCMPHEHFER